MTETAALKRLMVATAGGNQDAFKSLYDQTSPRLLALAMRIVNGRRDVAEDILQDAFVQIWHRSGDYHAEKGTPLAWMAGIVRYRALDTRRRECTRSDHTQRAAAEHEVRELARSSGSDIGSAELNLVLDCLDSIDEGQRVSILMTYIYGYTHSELAQQLQRPLGTIKTLIRRGLALVRECLKHDL